MKINWKVRMKNPSFWVSVIIAVVTPVFAYTGLTAQDMTTWKALWDTIKGAAANPYVLLMAAVSLYNAVIDPTTYGLADSKTALGYEAPKLEKEEKE